jgi:hypothetical protein
VGGDRIAVSARMVERMDPAEIRAWKDRRDRLDRFDRWIPPRSEREERSRMAWLAWALREADRRGIAAPEPFDDPERLARRAHDRRRIAAFRGEG